MSLSAQSSSPGYTDTVNANRAFDVSDDGTTVVGFVTTASGREAMRWTSGAGLMSLGDLPGGATDAEAFAASGDGSVVVGRATIASGDAAFVWTAATGMARIVLSRSMSLGRERFRTRRPPAHSCGES